MSTKCDTLAFLRPRWAKTLIHSRFWALDEVKTLKKQCFLAIDEQKRWCIRIIPSNLSTNADTFALFNPKWAKPLIHSHYTIKSEQKRWYIRTFFGLGKSAHFAENLLEACPAPYRDPTEHTVRENVRDYCLHLCSPFFWCQLEPYSYRC